MCSLCKQFKKVRRNQKNLPDHHREALLDSIGSEMEKSEDDEYVEHLQDLLEEILSPEEE